MKSIRIFLFLSFLTLALSSAGQEKSLPSDSTAIRVRKIDPAKVEQLKADPEMDYAYSPAAVNLWERFKRWFFNMLSRLLEAAFSANWFNILIVILTIVGLVYVIMRLLKVDALKMLYGERADKLPYGVLVDDIHAMDFEKLIEESRQKKEYRNAIRLVFLFALKLLSDKHHILWQPGKTNHDYVEELGVDKLKTGFNELSFYFEYAWYGNFAISEAMYKKVNALFVDWRTNV